MSEPPSDGLDANMTMNVTNLSLLAPAHIARLSERVNFHAAFAVFVHQPTGDRAASSSCMVKMSLLAGSSPAGSYAIDGSACAFAISASDDDGLAKGFWRFARALRVWRRAQLVTVPGVLRLRHAPADELWPLRGHQFSVAWHPAQFRTWRELDGYALDLAAFGTNQAEVAHISASPPSSPSPPTDADGAAAAAGGGVRLPRDALADFSARMAALRQRVSLWWPSHL